jgi:hypothetical protein
VNIIFLDCDGVLNHRGCDFSTDVTPVDPACVARAIRIAREGDAKFVVSSSWRYDDWRMILVDRGIPGELLLDRTPLDRITRGREITEWLDEHLVHAYVVLDDTTFDLGVHSERTVQTSMITGLRDEHVELALTILRHGVA